MFDAFRESLQELIHTRTALSNALLSPDGNLLPAALGWFFAYGCREFRAHDLVDDSLAKLLRLEVAEVPQDQPAPLINLAAMLFRYQYPAVPLRLNVSWLDRRTLYSWFYNGAITEFELEPFLGEDPPGVAAARMLETRFAPPLTAGVNLVGYPFSASGLGEDLRSLLAVFDGLGVPCSLFPLDHMGNAKTMYPGMAARVSRGLPHRTTVFCTNAFECERFFIRYGWSPFTGRHTIGLWPWEMERWPESRKKIFDLVDEIWAISTFVRDAYAAVATKPVNLVPPVVHVQGGEKERGKVFFFLFVFDFASGFERKNPLGVVQAFLKAFPRGNESVRLVLKGVNAEYFPAQEKIVKEVCARDIRLKSITARLGTQDMLNLMTECSCYVSLHRSEGFGRTIAEAMAAGKPVIATDWSGSRDLVKGEHGFPVRFSLVDVPEGAYPESRGCRWAEPDMDHAVELMRKVADMAPRDLAAVGRAAKAFIQDNFGQASVSGLYAKLLKARSEWS